MTKKTAKSPVKASEPKATREDVQELIKAQNIEIYKMQVKVLEIQKADIQKKIDALNETIGQ